jgi:hypothetical protein
MFELIWPTDTIDTAEEFSYEEYAKNPEKFGNHLFKADEYKVEPSTNRDQVSQTPKTNSRFIISSPSK